ncbi:MAG: hypothetical protein PHP37_03980 [Patescibacteria group bacterium]|jgi:G:T/U-mismatch repair DNA glycosylase|nr:hypothetical protein [Patescibacteria group bacterium]
MKDQKIKKTKREEIDARKKKAKELYEQGFTTREIGRMLERSHGWVSLVINE